MITKELLDILACPKCKHDLKLEGEQLVGLNSSCGLRYPIRGGIPVLLIEEAEKPNQRG